MQHSSDLERMVNLLALAADVMRKLAKPQTPEDQTAILKLADQLEGVADGLIEALFPQGPRDHGSGEQARPT